MAKTKLSPYKGKPLKLSMGIGSDKAQTLINPIKNNLVQTCNFCTVSCENDPDYRETLFYTFPVKFVQGTYMVTACTFCTQCRYLNLVGDGRGEIGIADYMSQNNLIMYYTLTKSAIHLSNKLTAAIADDQEALHSGTSESLQRWMEVGAKSSSGYSSLKGTFVDELMKFNRDARPSTEQDALVSYLMQLPQSEYAKEIKKINSAFRYIPRDITENLRVVEYFAENCIAKKYPITDWNAIAKKSEARRSAH